MGIFSGLPVIKLQHRLQRKLANMPDAARRARQLDARSSIAWMRGDHDGSRLLRAQANELRSQIQAHDQQVSEQMRSHYSWLAPFYYTQGEQPSVDGGGSA